MIIGVPLLKGNLNDGRCIFYLEENLRRKLQREGFIIKTFIPDNDYKFNAEDVVIFFNSYKDILGRGDKIVLADFVQLFPCSKIII